MQKNYGTIKKSLPFLLLILKLEQDSPYNSITNLDDLKSLVCSFLVLIYIYFYSYIVVFNSQLGSCQGFCRKLSTQSFSCFFHHNVIASLLPLSLHGHVFGKLKVSNGIVNNCFHCIKHCNCLH